MSLVKNSTKSDCPTKICNNNGIPFENTADLKQHVGDYFKIFTRKLTLGTFWGMWKISTIFWGMISLRNVRWQTLN
jgi:hypothetical protein